MIDSGDIKDIAIKVIDTEPKNRPWAINIIVICMCIIVCTITFFVFQTQKSEAIQDKLKAESKLDALQLLYVNEGKECPKLIREAEKNKDIEWQAKLDNLQSVYNKELKTKADKLEQDLNRIRKKLGQ